MGRSGRQGEGEGTVRRWGLRPFSTPSLFFVPFNTSLFTTNLTSTLFHFSLYNAGKHMPDDEGSATYFLYCKVVKSCKSPKIRTRPTDQVQGQSSVSKELEEKNSNKSPKIVTNLNLNCATLISCRHIGKHEWRKCRSWGEKLELHEDWNMWLQQFWKRNWNGMWAIPKTPERSTIFCTPFWCAGTRWQGKGDGWRFRHGFDPQNLRHCLTVEGVDWQRWLGRALVDLWR